MNTKKDVQQMEKVSQLNVVGVFHGESVLHVSTYCLFLCLVPKIWKGPALSRARSCVPVVVLRIPMSCQVSGNCGRNWLETPSTSLGIVMDCL